MLIFYFKFLKTNVMKTLTKSIIILLSIFIFANESTANTINIIVKVYEPSCTYGQEGATVQLWIHGGALLSEGRTGPDGIASCIVTPPELTYYDVHAYYIYGFSTYCKVVYKLSDNGSGMIYVEPCLEYCENSNGDSKGYNYMAPFTFELKQNYPNPFNPQTQIGYSTAKNGFVTIEVFDVLGQKVSTLVNEFEEAGKYSVIFDASSLTSGVYFYKIRTSEYVETKKMLLAK